MALNNQTIFNQQSRQETLRITNSLRPIINQLSNIFEIHPPTQGQQTIYFYKLKREFISFLKKFMWDDQMHDFYTDRPPGYKNFSYRYYELLNMIQKTTFGMYKRISPPPPSSSIINPTYDTDIKVAVTPPSPPSPPSKPSPLQPQPQLLTIQNDYYNDKNYKDASKYFYNGFYNYARRAIIDTDQAEAARAAAAPAAARAAARQLSATDVEAEAAAAAAAAARAAARAAAARAAADNFNVVMIVPPAPAAAAAAAPPHILYPQKTYVIEIETPFYPSYYINGVLDLFRDGNNDVQHLMPSILQPHYNGVKYTFTNTLENKLDQNDKTHIRLWMYMKYHFINKAQPRISNRYRSMNPNVTTTSHQDETPLFMLTMDTKNKFFPVKEDDLFSVKKGYYGKYGINGRIDPGNTSNRIPHADPMITSMANRYFFPSVTVYMTLYNIRNNPNPPRRFEGCIYMVKWFKSSSAYNINSITRIFFVMILHENVLLQNPQPMNEEQINIWIHDSQQYVCTSVAAIGLRNVNPSIQGRQHQNASQDTVQQPPVNYGLPILQTPAPAAPAAPAAAAAPQPQPNTRYTCFMDTIADYIGPSVGDIVKFVNYLNYKIPAGSYDASLNITNSQANITSSNAEPILNPLRRIAMAMYNTLVAGVNPTNDQLPDRALVNTALFNEGGSGTLQDGADQAKRNFVNAFLLRFKQKGDETRLTDAVELESMFRAQPRVMQRVPQNKREELMSVLQTLSGFLYQKKDALIRELKWIDKTKPLAVAAASSAARRAAASRGGGKAVGRAVKAAKAAKAAIAAKAVAKAVAITAPRTTAVARTAQRAEQRAAAIERAITAITIELAPALAAQALPPAPAQALAALAQALAALARLLEPAASLGEAKKTLKKVTNALQLIFEVETQPPQPPQPPPQTPKQPKVVVTTIDTYLEKFLLNANVSYSCGGQTIKTFYFAPENYGGARAGASFPPINLSYFRNPARAAAALSAVIAGAGAAANSVTNYYKLLQDSYRNFHINRRHNQELLQENYKVAIKAAADNWSRKNRRYNINDYMPVGRGSLEGLDQFKTDVRDELAVRYMRLSRDLKRIKVGLGLRRSPRTSGENDKKLINAQKALELKMLKAGDLFNSYYIQILDGRSYFSGGSSTGDEMSGGDEMSDGEGPPVDVYVLADHLAGELQKELNGQSKELEKQLRGLNPEVLENISQNAYILNCLNFEFGQYERIAGGIKSLEINTQDKERLSIKNGIIYLLTNTLASEFSDIFSPDRIDFLPSKIDIDTIPTDEKFREKFGEKLGENLGIIIQTIFNDKYRPINRKNGIICFNTNFRDTIIEFYLVLAELNYTMSDSPLISFYAVEEEEGEEEGEEEAIAAIAAAIEGERAAAISAAIAAGAGEEEGVGGEEEGEGGEEEGGEEEGAGEAIAAEEEEEEEAEGEKQKQIDIDLIIIKHWIETITTYRDLSEPEKEIKSIIEQTELDLKNIRKKYKKKLNLESSGTEELALEESVLEELVYQDIFSIINRMIDSLNSHATVPSPAADTATVSGPPDPLPDSEPPASLPVGGPLAKATDTPAAVSRSPASLAAATRALRNLFRRASTVVPKEVVRTGDKFRPSDTTSSGRNSYDSNGEYLENGGSKKNKKRKTRKNINKKRRIRKTTIKKALKNRNNKKTHKNAYKKRNLNKYRRIKKTKKKIQQTD